MKREAEVTGLKNPTELDSFNRRDNRELNHGWTRIRNLTKEISERRNKPQILLEESTD